MIEQAGEHRVDPDQLLTVADVAGHIGAHEQTVRLWIKQGELKAAKFGTRIGYRIRRGDYDDFLRRRRVTSAITRQLLSSASLAAMSEPQQRAVARRARPIGRRQRVNANS